MGSFIDPGASQKIIYQKYYIAFLDVLGFKELVYSENKNKIENYFGIVNSSIDYLKTIIDKQAIKSIIISDSIILSIGHGKNRQENISRLRNLCVAIGILQLNLAYKDIWLRGGVTSGNAYIDDDKSQVIGPAYIDAYLLEQNSAIYPRVIIDGKLINELNVSTCKEFISEINDANRDGLSYDNWGKSILFDWYHQNNSFLLKQDIPLFVDYLAYAFEMFDNSSEYLESVVSNIEKNIYKNPKIYSKYVWVLNYIKAISSIHCKQELSQNLLTIVEKIKSL